MEIAYNEMNVNLNTVTANSNAMGNRDISIASPTHGRHDTATSPPQMEQPQMSTQPIQNMQGGSAPTPMVRITSLVAENNQPQFHAKERGISADG